MSFKSLGQTLILLLCAVAVYLIDVSAVLPYVVWISVIGTVLILGYALYYSKNWGKPLFVFLLGAFLWTMPAAAQLTQEKVQEITAARDLCSADRTGDSYDKAVRDKAYYILSLSETLKSSDLSSTAKDVLICARQYTAFASSIDSAKINVCPTMADYMKRSAGDCWICGVGFLLIESVQRLASYTEAPVKKLALQLIAIMFLFWILIKVLMLFGTWGYANISEFFSDLFVRFFAVLVAVAFLYAPVKEVFSLTVSPLINMSAGLGVYITDLTFTQSEGQSFAAQAEQQFGISSDTICPYCYRMNDPDYSFNRADASYTPVFEDAAVNAMLCLTCKIYRQVSPFLAMGQTFMCYGTWKEATNFYIPFIVDINVPDFKLILFGILVVILFGIFLFLASFSMIDAFFRLGLVALFLPIFIATFVFPISRHYTVKAFSMVVYSILQLVGLAIAIALLLNLFLGFIPDSNALITHMLNNDVKAMLETLTGGGSFYMILVMAGILVMGMQIISGSNGIVSALSGIQDPGSYGMATGQSAVQGAWGAVKATAGVAMGSVAAAKEAQKGMSDVDLKKVRDGDFKGLAKDGMPASKTLKFSDKAADQADKGIQKAGKAAGQAVEKTGKAAGNAVDKGGSAAGSGMMGAGKGMMAKGAALSATGVGAIIGVPLMVAGAAVAATGAGVKGASKVVGAAMKVAGKAAGKTVETGSKAVGKASKQAIKGTAKVAEKTAEKTVQAAQGVQEKGGEKKNEKASDAAPIRSGVSQSGVTPGAGQSDAMPAGQSGGSSNPSSPNMDWAQNEKDAYAQGDNPIESGDLTKQ